MMHVFHIDAGEMMAGLTEQIAAAGIRDGAIVSLIGGVESFTISTMPADDATADTISTYQMPGEMHGSGEVRDGVLHVHATMGVQGDRAVVGHLHAAEVRTHFARAYVMPTA